MLSAEDIQKLKSVFATKEDFANFPTKDDFANFATKDDLINFATKDDIRGIREDLVNFATKDDFQELREDISDLKELVQGVIVGNESLAGTVHKLDVEYAAMSTQLGRHEKWIGELAKNADLELAAE